MSLLVEELDPDIVHMGTPMDPRLHIGLGDDQRHRFLEESRDLGCHGDEFGAAAQHPHGGVAEDAEARALMSVHHAGAVRIAVVAHAGEGEMVRLQPFEELHGFRDLGDVERRRILLVLRDSDGKTLLHRLPVLDREADITISRLQRRLERLLLVDPDQERQVDMDEAPMLAALRHSGQDRMGDEAGLDPPFGKRRKRRIQQERHVVIDDFEDGGVDRGHVGEADARLLLTRFGNMLHRGRRQHLASAGIETTQILFRDMIEQEP